MTGRALSVPDIQRAFRRAFVARRAVPERLAEARFTDFLATFALTTFFAFAFVTLVFFAVLAICLSPFGLSFRPSSASESDLSARTNRVFLLESALGGAVNKRLIREKLLLWITD